MMTIDRPRTEVRRDALGLITNGLYVLTSSVDEAVHATTVSWVSQVSSQPPLVLVALRRNSHLAAAVRKAKRFALNILTAEQEELAQRFFRHVAIENAAGLLEDSPFRLGQTKVPLLTDAMAWVECRLVATPESPGDHDLALGEVVGAGVRRLDAPMVMWQTSWSYGGYAPIGPPDTATP